MKYQPRFPARRWLNLHRTWVRRIAEVSSNHALQFRKIFFQPLLFSVIGGTEDVQANHYPSFRASMA